ncbi:MAG TPA: exodeoxyribonuclease VII large subunit [Myxococcota bacterium]|nr:exodeoxyribonuclease VII large subunit [Myxococcota bacterium]HQK50557.1 exodeoxyribonuclease VII large subunit [Myxococcota bacterium]
METVPIPNDVLSVLEVSRRVRTLLESSFSRVRVEGEVTGLHRAASGHVYFSLSERDSDGGVVKLDCVVYRHSRAAAGPEIQNGRRVICAGRLTAWGGSSRYQMSVDSISESGIGEMLRRLEELRRRLAAEGLFDPARKRPIPTMPRRIGVVTSLRGAAVRDIVRTIRTRFPARVLLVDSLVQGEGAAESLAKGIELLNLVPDVDVILVGRGGGSLEDLWAFNEEVLVRAVASSRVPVISGVGHEVDRVLTDEAADLRAPTPTAAAAAACPSMEDLRERLAQARERMDGAIQRRLETASQRLDEWEARLSRVPDRVLQGPRMGLQALGDRLDRLPARLLEPHRHGLAMIQARLQAIHPVRHLQQERRHLDVLGDRLRILGPRLLDPERHQLDRMLARLEPLSPLRPLERGYALVRRPDGAIVRRSSETAPGEDLEVWLSDGALAVQVRETLSKRPG